MGEPKIEKLLDNQAIADVFGLSIDTIDKLRKEDGLPHYIIRKHPKYRASEIEQWLKERKRVGS